MGKAEDWPRLKLKALVLDNAILRLVSQELRPGSTKATVAALADWSGAPGLGALFIIVRISGRTTHTSRIELV